MKRNEEEMQKTQRNPITLNTESLTAEQERILKQIHFMTIDVMKTDCEVEFFEKSSMLMKLFCQSITKSHFGKVEDPSFETIPYAKQAIEYSLENLQDSLSEGEIDDFDH